MDSTCSVGGHARRRTVALRSPACSLLLVLALIGFGPAAHTAAADSCSPEVVAAQMQGLQQAVIGKLMVAQLQSDLLPGGVLLEDAQRQVQGLGPSGVADLLIELNTQVAAALSSIDPLASPDVFDASVGTALDRATPTEQEMTQLAMSASFFSVVPLQQALDDLRSAWLDLHTALANASVGISNCQTTLDACALVPLADAQALLGTSDITAPPITGSLPERVPGLQESSICEYHTILTQTHNGLVTAFALRFDDPHSADVAMKQFQQGMSSGGGAPQFSDVAGLGDAAVRASGQLPAVTGGGRLVMVLVRRGSFVLQVTAGVLPDVGPADLDTAVEQVVVKAFSRLTS